MRLVPILTAALVTAVLFLLVIERDALLSFAHSGSTDASAQTETAEAAPAATAEPTRVVRVVARHSKARVIDSAVVLRGQTEAVRQVDVMAETSGRVISEPLRKGSTITAGQVLCELDPGTRAASLAEALARLAEAQARVPEAEARLAEARAALPAAEARISEAEATVPAAEAGVEEARAGVPAAHARLSEAEARVPEAEARLLEARAAVPAAEARLLEAQAAVPAAQARLAEAQARLPEAEARLIEAQARVDEVQISLNASEKLATDGFASDSRVAASKAAMASAKAGVQSVLSQFKAAEAGVQAARSQVEGARAGVSAAESQVQSAHAAIVSAESMVKNAHAGVETAISQVEGAKARVKSALGQVEGAKAAVISARSGLEGAAAAVQSAMSGIENAKAGIQAAEAAVATTRREIDRLTVTAPFGGMLETDTAELGSFMQASGPSGAHCATILQLDPIKLVGFVPETEVNRVELGAMAGARLAAGGTEVIGTVTFLSRAADPVTRTFRVEIEVPNPDLAIRDGQTAEIGIAAEGARAHLLPQSALTLDDDGALGVRLVAEDKTALFAAVTLLRDTAQGVWVSGLPDAADVILVGQEYVTDGVAVDPTYQEATQ